MSWESQKGVCKNSWLCSLYPLASACSQMFASWKMINTHRHVCADLCLSRKQKYVYKRFKFFIFPFLALNVYYVQPQHNDIVQGIYFIQFCTFTRSYTGSAVYISPSLLTWFHYCITWVFHNFYSVNLWHLCKKENVIEPIIQSGN